jgi:hypothetical protein
MVCGVVVMVEAAVAFVAAGAIVVAVVLSVVVVESVPVLVLVFWLPQEAKQKRTTTSKGVAKEHEGFIVEDFKMKNKQGRKEDARGRTT